MIPAALPSLSMAVAQAVNEGASMVTGRVVEFSSNGLFVAPGGPDSEPVLAGYPRAIYQPVLGETVMLLNQGGMWYCVGSIAGPGDATNSVDNYSFEDSEAGAFPRAWTLVTTAGSPTLTTFDWRHPEIIDGGKVGSLAANVAATTTCSVVSRPIPAAEKETWGVGAYYRPNAGFGTNSGTVRIYVSWYSGSELSNLISEESAVTFPLLRGHGWRLLTENGASGRGSVAPVGTKFVRVKLTFSWSAAAGDVVYLDRITARRTS